MKLVLPTPAEEEAVMALRHAFLCSGQTLLGAGGLECYENYGEWLARVQALRSGNAAHHELPPATVYLIREGDSLIGIAEIRHRLTDFQKLYGGHIGLSIRPECRAAGVLEAALALALSECRNLNISRVLMVRSRYDEASRAAIERNGGVLENETAYEGDILCRYWIPVPAALCRPLSADELDGKLFAQFIRRQEVKMCRRRIGVEWRMVHCPFVDDWTQEQLIGQIQDLQTVLLGGGAVFGAFMDGAVKGFVCVDARPMGPGGRYRDLLSLHVSADCRGRGMGRMLFQAAARWAADHGGEKLYISAHSAMETQAFYAAMGCRDAQWISAEHTQLEPFDCQLEYDVGRNPQ